MAMVFGSSPRAWGTPYDFAVNTKIDRFIPTGVGNTRWTFAGAGSATVHPHGRGEHNYCGYLGSTWAGSSPRAWGTLYSILSAMLPSRFIPTGVGNTDLIASRTSGVTVHPHGRGEHDYRVKCAHSHSGSSPRAWGTRQVRAECIFCNRFIPTGVGNTAHVI